jgi:polysaccharide deacetylase 2 family uncharacterized protein YibQ
MTAPSLFETEMRSQIAAAESAVLEAVNSGDAVLVEISSNQLDDLIALARRNGLEIAPTVPFERDVTITEIDLTATEAQTA